MKNILFLCPINTKPGQPSFQRIRSFEKFYQNNSVKIFLYPSPITIKDKIKLIVFIYRESINNVFLSMPPFRNWFLFIMPKIQIILDIRDGWSIAIKNGYGGLTKSNMFKAYIASIVEKLAIKRSVLTITCTQGLKDYLSNLSKREILMITNGYSKEDYEIVQKLIDNNKIVLDKDDEPMDYAVCVGKFSEYGKDKVKIILEKINKNDRKTVIKLIGSNKEKNEWIESWLKNNNIKNISIQFLQWLEREDMYKEILNSTYGITVIRDANYDYGTKVFDYILCKVSIFNYFSEENLFTEYFNNYLLSEIDTKKFYKSFLREDLIEEKKYILLNCLK